MDQIYKDPFFNTKLKSFLNQYEVREKQFKSVLRAKDLELQVALIELNEARQQIIRTADRFIKLQDIITTMQEYNSKNDTEDTKPSNYNKVRPNLYDTCKTVFKSVKVKSKVSSDSTISSSTSTKIDSEIDPKIQSKIHLNNGTNNGTKRLKKDSHNSPLLEFNAERFDSLPQCMKAGRDYRSNISDQEAQSRLKTDRYNIITELQTKLNFLMMGIINPELEPPSLIKKIKNSDKSLQSEDFDKKYSPPINKELCTYDTVEDCMNENKFEINRGKPLCPNIEKDTSEIGSYKGRLDQVISEKVELQKLIVDLEKKLSSLVEIFRYLQSQRDHWLRIATQESNFLSTDTEIMTKKSKSLKQGETDKIELSSLLDDEIDSINCQIEALIFKKNSLYTMHASCKSNVVNPIAIVDGKQKKNKK